MLTIVKKVYLSPKARLHSKNRSADELSRRRSSSVKRLDANRSAAENYKYNVVRESKPITLNVPQVFSLLKNRNELLLFFRKVDLYIGKGFRVFLNLAAISTLEPEALLYLLSYLDKLKKDRKGSMIMGNTPVDPRLKALLTNSGFYKYVFTGNSLGNSNMIMDIEHGINVKPEIAKKVKDFALRHLGEVDDKKTLYPTIIECMANTLNHAYGKHDQQDWWLMAIKDESTDCVHFTFLDNGKGIPNTVARRFLTESFKDESTLIQSALNGELRTRTGKPWRGKGLPKIYSSIKNKRISNLLVISGKGFYESKSGIVEDSNEKFRGTLLAWDYTRKKNNENNFNS